MLKFGKIQEVDAAKGRVKVRFDEDDLVSDWIPYIVPQTKENKYNYYPVSGEHVACQMDENCENGVVMGAIYSSADALEPSIQGSLAGVKIGPVTISITPDVINIIVGDTYWQLEDGFVTVVTTQFKVTADTIQLEGDVSVDGGLETSGSITADGEVTTNKLGAPVNLSTHIHLGVTPGPGVTGTPQPGS